MSTCMCIRDEGSRESEIQAMQILGVGLGVDINYSLEDILLCVCFHGYRLSSARRRCFQKNLTANPGQNGKVC